MLSAAPCRRAGASPAGAAPRAPVAADDADEAGAQQDHQHEQHARERAGSCRASPAAASEPARTRLPEPRSPVHGDAYLPCARRSSSRAVRCTAVDRRAIARRRRAPARTARPGPVSGSGTIRTSRTSAEVVRTSTVGDAWNHGAWRPDGHEHAIRSRPGRRETRPGCRREPTQSCGSTTSVATSAIDRSPATASPSSLDLLHRAPGVNPDPDHHAG